ncbi:GerAB/ArcD/ProY family transporter [Paenibacillus sp. OAS669]|uniref:GerAB/ArcD/ProY family transporter n=1 Tax=Paenibacillus sp. OAS669 TaxID=2663821 RepID=UPI00178AED0A|nr:endospore germination permease [Paenibacillus sp. OAS669]MBE1443036.1 spore germination protein KB [Paenibacillus sp. OAS669]
MIDKGKISALQLGMLMYLMIGATSTLIVPAITAKQAERDMWLSPILGSISGFIVVIIMWALHKKFPGQSIMQFGELLLGRFLGKCANSLVLFFLLHGVGLILREYGEFVVSAFLSRTPMVTITMSLIVVCAFAVRSGIEVLARCTQLFLPFIGLVFVCIFAMLIPDMDPRKMLPMLEKGILPALQGSIVPHTWFLEFFLITFLFPFVHDLSKGLKAGMFSVLFMMLIMVATNFASLFVFGNLTGHISFPVYYAASYISFINFIEHLDAIVMVTWILGGFVQIALWYYSLVIGTAQWLGLSHYRFLVFPMGLLCGMTSIWVTPSLQDLIHFFATTAPFYSFTILFLYPLILLAISWVRKTKNSSL